MDEPHTGCTRRTCQRILDATSAARACAQAYLKASGVPHTTLLTCMFYENFVKAVPYRHLPDGAYEFGINLGNEPHGLNAAAAIGQTAASTRRLLFRV